MYNSMGSRRSPNGCTTHQTKKYASAYARRVLGPRYGKTRLGVRAARSWAMGWENPPPRTRGAPLGHGMAKHASAYARRVLGPWYGKTRLGVRAARPWAMGWENPPRRTRIAPLGHGSLNITLPAPVLVSTTFFCFFLHFTPCRAHFRSSE